MVSDARSRHVHYQPRPSLSIRPHQRWPIVVVAAGCQIQAVRLPILCLNRRTSPTTLQQQVQLQQVVELDELQHWLHSKFTDAPGKTAFVEDVVLVSQMLGCLLDCSAVGLRLKTTESAVNTLYVKSLCVTFVDLLRLSVLI